MQTEQVDIPALLRRLGIDARLSHGEYHALCPSHTDKRPSWSINARTGGHYCFSCGFGGGVAALVVRALEFDRVGLGYREAWDWMRREGLVKGSTGSALAVSLRLAPTHKRAFEMPDGVVTGGPLSKWPAEARAYLEKRRIEGWQVTRWGLGYAEEGRLAGRVVFPVRSSTGALLSYSARTYRDHPVRYLTPDGNEGADQGAIFGEQGWPPPSQRKDVVVVEGAIKGLAVERVVGCNVAGLLGARRTSNPTIVGKLATFRRVVVLLDADAAGDKGSSELVPYLVRYASVLRVRMPGAPVDDAPDQEIEEVLGCLAALPGFRPTWREIRTRGERTCDG